MNTRPSTFTLFTYALAATVLTLAIGVNWKKPNTVLVTGAAGEAEVDLRRTRNLIEGLKLKNRARIRTYEGFATMTHEGTMIYIAQNTNLELREISHERLAFYTERGYAHIKTSDRPTRICTREICATAPAGSELLVDYITPGEYMYIAGTDVVTIEHKNGATYTVPTDVTFYYDELKDISEFQEARNVKN